MWYSELFEFIEEVELLEKFLAELASKEEEIQTFGLRRVVKWDSYLESKEAFNGFEIKLLEIIKLARHIDKEIADSMSNISRAGLTEDITKIKIRLKILESKKPLQFTGEAANTILFYLPHISGFFKSRQLFKKEDISLHQVLVNLTRIVSLSKRLSDLYIRRQSWDNEIFKPSNINDETLIEYINTTIFQINENISINKIDKEKLIEYLEGAKIELSKDNISWNKVVGALVITATLLSGVAAAPLAYENTTKAINYILGTSIENHIPNLLIEPPEKEKKQKEENIQTEPILI